MATHLPTDRPPRIGVFGGTFDPPHVGHLVAAVNARAELHLDVVLLVVAHEPWQKVGAREVLPSDDRLAMARAAVGDVEGVEASDLEIVRGGTSFTADTLAELSLLHPGAELFLVIGADVADQLDTWERVDAVRELATLCVVNRPGARRSGEYPGWRWAEVNVPDIDLSSTDLRERARTGRPLDYLIPEAAVRCIRERHLYADQ